MFIDDHGLTLWTVATGRKPLGSHDLNVRKPFVCADGFQVSIQASSFHYSIPRDDYVDRYEAFELGYPSEHDVLLDDYVEWYGEEEEPNWTKCIYPFVDRDVVIRLINKHGGVGSM